MLLTRANFHLSVASAPAVDAAVVNNNTNAAGKLSSEPTLDLGFFIA